MLLIDGDADLWTTYLTARQAAQAAHVRPPTIYSWQQRGHLAQARDERGRPMVDHRGRKLFRLIDVVRAEGGAWREEYKSLTRQANSA